MSALVPNVSEQNKRFVELYIANGRNAPMAYREVYGVPQDAAPGYAEERGNKLLRTTNVQRYLALVTERLLFEETAADPLHAAKLDTVECAARSIKAELAVHEMIDGAVNDKAARKARTAAELGAEVKTAESLVREDGPGDPSEVDYQAQPMTMLHLGVMPQDAVGQSVEVIRYSEDWILQLLENNIARAMQIAPVVDKQGRPTGMYVYNGGVVNKAVELIARMKGYLIDRKQIDVRQLSDLSDTELARKKRDLHRRLAEERGEAEDINFKEGSNAAS